MKEPSARVTFLGASPSSVSAVPAGGFAFLGVPFASPYAANGSAAFASPPGAFTAGAPDAVRIASSVYAGDLDHYDFDLGAALEDEVSRLPLVDCGDVPCDPRDPAAAAARTTEAVHAVVAGGSVPLVVGGDHAVPPFVIRGLDPRETLHVLHIDAHLDFRDEVGGMRDGYSSPIRRLRDLPFVETIVQVGLRDIGSARPREIADALAAGNVLVRAEDVHEAGVDGIPALFPERGRVYITVDVDGLDPSCAPGVRWPAPGGLQFWQAARLVRGVVRRGRLAGMDVCELVPARDPQGLTALTVARLLMIALGAALRP